MSNTIKKAIILLSGGLDSTTTVAIARDAGFELRALSIFYGQRNHIELNASKRVVDFFKIPEHKIINLDLRLLGGSALTDDIEVPQHESISSSIPATYVPARNTIMLSLALAYAEVSEAYDIFFGANIHDYSGYPDCRPAYIKAFENMANLATKSATEKNMPLRIHAPLLNLSKAEIIKRGVALHVPYELTHSCYAPLNDRACGQCSACFYRRKGFLDALVPDPTLYHEPFSA
jgi:7-cyano-7-deazaguanine synthase